MGAREIVRVFPLKEGWVVSYRGGQRQMRFERKDDAEAAALEFAKGHRPSTLMMINEKGDSEYEIVF